MEKGLAAFLIWQGGKSADSTCLINEHVYEEMMKENEKTIKMMLKKK